MSRLHLIALGLAIVSPAINLARAQEVRPYPDPGYGRLGVYGGGDDRYFDYCLHKISLDESSPNKASWWAGLKDSRGDSSDARRHDIYLVYYGERQASLESARKRLDAWLASDPDCPTYPELIPAICLGEENVDARREVLDGLARHVRQRYRIPVFQWYSDPLPPDPDLTADGWIWDSYGWESVAFRKHLMKFVSLGKPAICVPWATDPHWPQWTRYPTAAEMINRQWLQFDTSREFNVSCAVFAVAGPMGSVNHWIASPTREMVNLRNALLVKREEMHSIRPGVLPLASANFSARDRSIQAGGDPPTPSVYEETFSGFTWIADADIRGFLDLILTSRPEQPGLLTVRTDPARAVRASLVYRFESYFPLERVEVALDAAAPAKASCRNTLAISTDELGREWPLEVDQQGADSLEALRLHDSELLKGRHVFFVRVLMENRAEQADLPGNRLDRLQVRCVHQPPAAGAAAMLVADAYGNLAYEDDFRSQRWPHLGRLEVEHPTHGGFRAGGFWVGMKGGYATSTKLLQRVSSPQPLGQLVVAADCDADGKNLGGSVALGVGPRGEEPKWEVRTEARHSGPLQLEIPSAELAQLRDFDVHVKLHSSSGVEGDDRACATVRGLSIHAK
ncbi:MAG: hypothetical protein HUU20_06830 [Pirellulales bacterium]|nr:hypothetical protein [Pirellulales bacterium]